MKWMHRLTSAAALLAVVLTGCGGSTPTEAPPPHGGFTITSWAICTCAQSGGYVATVTVNWTKSDTSEAAYVRLYNQGAPLDTQDSCQVTPGDGSCSVRINLGTTVPTWYEAVLSMSNLALPGGRKEGAPPVCGKCPL